MGTQTKIEWCDSTWNPLRGCSRVSEGCRNCYAERVAGRFSGPGLPYEGLATMVCGNARWTGKVELVGNHLLDPMKWNPVPLTWSGQNKRTDVDLFRPRRIFVNSMSDLFHEAVTDEMRDYIFAVMAICQQHVFQVLTKRPERMRAYCTDPALLGRIIAAAQGIALELGGYAVAMAQEQEDGFTGVTLPNVWLGVSVENQATADERIPLLLQTPAAVRFVSCEPLLGPVDLTRVDDNGDGLFSTLDGMVCCEGRGWNHWRKLDWVICGGESGPGARPMHPDWARSLRDQCEAAGVPYFFKQWGEWRPPVDGEKYDTSNGVAGKPAAFILENSWVVNCFHHPAEQGAVPVVRVGKQAAGSLLDGREWKQFPEVIG